MHSARALFVSLLACSAVAQEAPPSASAAERRARDMREQVSEGRVLKSHVKVRVRLDNGSRLTGVVKDGRLVERVDGLHFVRADADERGAGIRLYYTSGTRGFVFVPFASLKSYEVLQRLSQQQVQQVEAEMQRAEQRAEERRARAAELEKVAAASAAPTVPAAPTAPPATLRNPPPGPADLAGWQPTRPAVPAPSEAAPANAEPSSRTGGSAAADEGEAEAEEGAVAPAASEAEQSAEQSEEQLRWGALLREYPPKQGWNRTKRDEISRRFVVLGAQPSAVEKAFVAQFDEWLKACDAFGVDPDVAVVAPPQTRRQQRRAERDRTRSQRK